MDFKITLGIWNAESKEEARERINEMLGAYDLHNFSGVEINWLDDEDEGDVKPLVKSEKEKRTFVKDMTVLCLHSVDSDKEYEFPEAVILSNNRYAKKFWVDDGNETVRVEIWQVWPEDSWVMSAMLDEPDEEILPLEDAYKLAENIRKTIWG